MQPGGGLTYVDAAFDYAHVRANWWIHYVFCTLSERVLCQAFQMSLAKTQAIADLAEVLAEYLPGKPHPFADPEISFPGVAQRLGLGKFWPRSGSKTPSVRTLLTAVLAQDERRFCTLVLEIVRIGIGYRSGKQPVTRQDIETLDALVRRVGFGIRDFRDPTFLRQLPEKVAAPSSTRTFGPSPDDTQPSRIALEELRQEFIELAELAPVVRGHKFEKVLGSLFDSFGLAPRSAFRLIGEQIDGSFELGAANYLVEAKWQAPKMGQEQLLVFSGKVGGKAEWSRGLFVSYSGFTTEGLQAFRVGKRTNIVCMDRMDLDFVLSGKGSLPELLRRKVRRATESNVRSSRLKRSSNCMWTYGDRTTFTAHCGARTSRAGVRRDQRRPPCLLEPLQLQRILYTLSS